MYLKFHIYVYIYVYVHICVYVHVYMNKLQSGRKKGKLKFGETAVI